MKRDRGYNEQIKVKLNFELLNVCRYTIDTRDEFDAISVN